jgi:oxygen-dependent protoporphyrinogen oxidase
MTLAFRDDQLARVPDGFGFVVPALERRTILAVTVNSLKFENRAPPGHVLLRAFLGGAMHPHVYDLPDEVLREAVLKDLRELMGVRGEPLLSELYRWPSSMPQYPVGHLDRVARIRGRLEAHQGLMIAGNALGGVGVPDCVASAEAAAERALHHGADVGPPI